MSGHIREFSIVILGADGVGKSELALRFMKGYYHEGVCPNCNTLFGYTEILSFTSQYDPTVRALYSFWFPGCQLILKPDSD
jgi:GTPase SAR1 family protein